MAELLDQSEIDALLNSSMDDAGEEEDVSTDESGEAPTGGEAE